MLDRQTDKQARDLHIDLIKGIALFFMVACHAGCDQLSFVYLFHMPVFFIASGYLYRNNCTNSFVDLMKYFFRKIKGLWLPYFLFTCLFILLNNLFIVLNVYTVNPDFANAGISDYVWMGDFLTIKAIIKCIIFATFFETPTQMGGAFWFFKVLFFVLILYALVDFIIVRIAKKTKSRFIIQGFIAGLFLALGFYCSVKDISLWDFNKVFSAYALVYIGILIKRLSLHDKIKIRPAISALIATILTVLLVICFKFIGGINFAGNMYVNPVYLIFTSFAGWILLYLLSDILICISRVLCIVFQNISIHSVYIIALHFLSFKIINLIGVIIYQYPLYYVAAFPILMRGGFWWILYSLSGIVLPILVSIAVSKTLSLYRRNKSKL